MEKNNGSQDCSEKHEENAEAAGDASAAEDGPGQ